MKMISNNSDYKLSVGIDIGSSKICCAIGQTNSASTKIKLLGLAITKSNGIKKGIITDRDKLIETIEKVLTDAEIMANIKVKSAYLSITGEHIRSINTQAAIALNRINGVAGNVSERSIEQSDIHQVLDLAQAVSLPVDKDILHTIPQEYVVDNLEDIKNPLGMSGRRLEARVHLVTAASTAINNLISCVEELGIHVNGLVFQPVASALAALEKDEIDLGVTLLELGSNTTNIAVYHGSALRHSATIPIGSDSITNDIAVMLQISKKEAEKIKINYTSAKSSMSSNELEIKYHPNKESIARTISEHEVSEYVEARMQEILQMIIREISRADIKDPLTYGIVTTGGGAELRNISSLIEKNLNVKVRMGKPNRIEGAEDIANNPKFTTVLGLLLWPVFSIDHVQLNLHNSGGIKNLFKKIRHTIEDMF